MATRISHSPADTFALGEEWGRAAQKGLVIGLSGDLGAGKTQLVKGLALGLGITTRVHSPTFTLANVYSGGRLTLYHLDLYRLDTYEQIIAAGLEEYLHPDGITVIEWAERWFGNVSKFEPVLENSQGSISESNSQCGTRPPNFRFVRIESLSETDRRITYEDSGA
jgi:tRNA threonylcarbamoyladenosine biosynthesis protein TsaE